MNTLTVDLRPKVKQYEANGRQKLADVHYRIDIPAYSRALNDYSEETREAEKAAVAAFDKEVVALLLSDGWTLRKENYGPGSCPQLKKGAQYLYCHPHDISGVVDPDDIDKLEQIFRNIQSCKYRWTDNLGDVIVTTSEQDELQLYCDTYSDSLVTEVFVEMTTTKRKNLYKCKWEVLRGIANKLAIANRRSDLDDISTGYYRDRKPLTDFVVQYYGRFLNAGFIKEATGKNDMPLCRWANKTEQREIERLKKVS